MGVEIVDVIMYAVVTQTCWSRPCSSSAIVFMAVPTTFWSSAAKNMPDISPMRIVVIWCGVSSSDERAACVAVVICPLGGAVASATSAFVLIQRLRKPVEVRGEVVDVVLVPLPDEVGEEIRTDPFDLGGQGTARIGDLHLVRATVPRIPRLRHEAALRQRRELAAHDGQVEVQMLRELGEPQGPLEQPEQQRQGCGIRHAVPLLERPDEPDRSGQVRGECLDGSGTCLSHVLALCNHRGRVSYSRSGQIVENDPMEPPWGVEPHGGWVSLRVPCLRRA